MSTAVHDWMWRVKTDRLSLTDDGQVLSSLNCWLRWPSGNVPGECEHVFDQTRDCIVLFVQHESWAELQCWQRLLRHDFTCFTHQPCQEDARLRGCCPIGNFDKYIDRLGRTPQFLSPGPCGLSSEILRSYFIWVFGGEIKCIFPSACDSDTAPAPLSLSRDWNGEVWSVTDWRTLIGRLSWSQPCISTINPVMLLLFGLHYSEGIYLWHNNHIILRLILIVILWTAGTGVLR